MLLHDLPKLSELSDDDVLEQFSRALRDVGAETQFLSYRPPDQDVEDESQYVERVHAELRRRGIDPAPRLVLLTSETGWLMAELLAECVAWPPVRPWVRGAADGLRIAMRCRACEMVEFPADARLVRLCDNCLDIFDDAIATRKARDNLLLFRTYNAEARCCEDAGDDTVLGVYPWSPDWSGDNPIGLCRACVDGERERRKGAASGKGGAPGPW